MIERKSLVSIIIPTKNSGHAIKNCLESIREQTYLNIEVIVADGNSTDDTREIAEKFDAKLVDANVCRSEARNIGAKVAIGEFLFSLDSDMELLHTVVRECVAKAKQGYDAVIIPEVSVGKGFWARCKALEKSCYIGDETIEAARFFRRNAFDTVHGYDPELEFGEDWDLNLRIRKARYRIGRIHAFIRHHEGQLTLREAILKKHHYGKTMKLYRTKHPKEAKEQLRPIRPAFMRNWRKLAEDPIHGLGMLFMKTCEFGAASLADI